MAGYDPEEHAKVMAMGDNYGPRGDRIARLRKQRDEADRQLATIECEAQCVNTGLNFEEEQKQMDREYAYVATRQADLGRSYQGVQSPNGPRPMPAPVAEQFAQLEVEIEVGAKLLADLEGRLGGFLAPVAGVRCADSETKCPPSSAVPLLAALERLVGRLQAHNAAVQDLLHRVV